ncbi:MAG TPA: hypothetical protein VH208_07775, partial [Myxococcaceae bacterium]|nr:hypothetical protein [Myxococcaceae bacterium]
MKSSRLIPLLGVAALLACSGSTPPGPDAGSGDSGTRGNDAGRNPDGGNLGDAGGGTVVPFPATSI